MRKKWPEGNVSLPLLHSVFDKEMASHLNFTLRMASDIE